MNIKPQISPGLKKGDEAFWVSISANHGAVSVYARRIVVQALGVKNGWALSQENGKPVRQRIYPSCHTLLRTQAEVEAWAAEHAPAFAESDRLRWIDILVGNFPNLHAHLRSKFQAEIDRLRASVSSYKITYA